MTNAPADAAARRAIKPVICYPNDTLPVPDLALYRAARATATKTDEVSAAPRDACTFRVPAGHFFRISAPDGPQVGDLNLWNANDLSERFPHMRPMATITDDTLGWYGIDEYGGSVHDVIGTRCDPYTGNLLNGTQYHHCCHSNLTRALAAETGLSRTDAEPHVHDVLNVFMCTGFTRDTGQYFMKSSPVRPDDHLEFFAEIDLLGALSACPGGDCSSEHSSDTAKCERLLVEIFAPAADSLGNWQSPAINAYDRTHGA
ncbi:hypothetical protein GQR58_000245 [Nymphon striatum]|nr:hypothetical protein GQR58_000245 [Nymphon striatum]